MLPVVLLALVGPFAAPRSPTAFVGLPYAGPSSDAWLGTDGIGRDVLSRVLWGGREILGLAALATVIGIVAGTALGTTAGYAKGALDEVIMRTLDVALAFPQIILALLLVSIIGPKLWLVCLAVAAIHAPQVARVARAATVRTVEQDHVKYAEAFGIPRRNVILGEVVPNIMSPVMVETGLRLTYSIAIIASGRMTNEELWLTSQLARLLGTQWIDIVPRVGRSDQILLSRDRNQLSEFMVRGRYPIAIAAASPEHLSQQRLQLHGVPVGHVVMEPALRLIQGDAYPWSEQTRSCPVIRGSGHPTKLTEPRLGCALRADVAMEPRADVRNVGSRTPVRGSVLTTRADLNCFDFLRSQSWGCRTAG